MIASSRIGFLLAKAEPIRSDSNTSVIFKNRKLLHSEEFQPGKSRVRTQGSERAAAVSTWSPARVNPLQVSRPIINTVKGCLKGVGNLQQQTGNNRQLGKVDLSITAISTLIWIITVPMSKQRKVATFEGTSIFSSISDHSTVVE
ncbi:hypothetical protein BTVI_16064 [Pitangus sulphuratus]|nr:hypothetical protein BTVI_16064 [Pitangus sulphuratus]